MPEPDLEIRKAEGGGGGVARSPRNIFGPFGPQFGLNIRGGGREGRGSHGPLH